MEERKSTINSSLKFNNYIVNQVNFKVNESANNEEKNWNLTFNISNRTMVNEEKNQMNLRLKVSVFKDIQNAPFYMDVEITGFFELIGEDDISKYEANAIAIMYPYLRAIVSTYTASANINPLILPAINVNAMLKRKNKQKEN